jgi:membrane protease YdiL (CAAX protease family)
MLTEDIHPASNASAFLDTARAGRQGIRWFLASILLSLSAWQIAGALPYLLYLLFGNPADLLASFIAVNTSFIFLVGGLYLSVRIFHHLPPASLISPEQKFKFAFFWQAFLVWLVISTLTTLVDALIRPGVYAFTFSWNTWLPFLATALVLTPIQAGAEELLFRGYLLQQTSRLTTRPWLLAVISGTLFMLPHFANPEMQADFLLTALFYFSFGAFAALVTLRAGRLEYAIGIHTANNLGTVLLTNYQGSALPSPAIYTASSLNPLFNLITFLLDGLICWYFLFKVIPLPSRTKGNAAL